MTRDFLWKYVERPRRYIEHYKNKLLGWDNVKKIQHEVNKHRYELCWDAPFNIVRLIGWTDQYDEDLYYVIYNRKEGVHLYSCVGGFVYLKDYVPKWEYANAEYVFELNTTNLLNILNMVEHKEIKLK